MMKLMKTFDVAGSAPENVLAAVAWYTVSDNQEWQEYVPFVIDTKQELLENSTSATMYPIIWQWLLDEGAVDGETVLLEIASDLF